MIPDRYRRTCPFCPDPVDTRRGRGSVREVSGWEPLRSQGGGNALALRAETGRYAHAVCVDLEQSRSKRRGWIEERLPFDEVPL